VHELYYAFAVEGERTRNLSANPVGDQWRPSVGELRGIAGTLAPEAGQILPDARVHPARPTHDTSEQPLPTPTPCPPIRTQDFWAGYGSLDALIADSDAVVVGRPTTRAREITGAVDDKILLENDVLVEQAIGGDATSGQLLPVERLAARDPSCQLIADGNPPLTIDRPYLMALRREGDRFVLTEAPLALAEVRAGVLSSTRWPELDGLTIPAARERLALVGATEGPTSNDPVDALVADLEKAGAPVTRLGSLPTMPLGGRGVALCVAGQKVRLNVYASADEAARVAGTIDPTDPSHIGDSMIVSWQGDPKFWSRDRMLVLFLGADGAVATQVLIDVLGPPFAAGSGRQAGPSGDAC
ncbi:MAG: hypothetical protein ACLGIJ_06475, partial [Candidatus Limnocylindria bacterium]